MTLPWWVLFLQVYDVGYPDLLVEVKYNGPKNLDQYFIF